MGQRNVNTAPGIRWHTDISAALSCTGAPFAEHPADDVFYTWDWFNNLNCHGVSKEHRPLIATLVQPDGAVICLPLLRRQRGMSALYGPVTGALSTYYSSLFGPIGRAEDCTVDTLRYVVKSLRKTANGANVIDLQPVASDGHFCRSMTEALRTQGYWTDSFFCFGNWYEHIKGRSFDEYYTIVPSRIQNTIRRARKKFESTEGWRLDIVTEAGPALDDALTSFQRVYAKSWKVPEPFPEFMPNLIRSAAARGWLRLGVVKLGETPIAAQLWLVHGGKASIYKLAYDEDFKKLSAGSVLTADLMRHVIDVDQVVEIDYLTGDDPYKADWMTQRRERHGIVAFYPWSIQGLLSAAKHFGAKWWRQKSLARPPNTA